MPFRALMWSVVTAALALLVVGMWVRAIEPLYQTSLIADTQAAAQEAAAATAHSPQHRALASFIRGISLLAFVLIASLFAVGLLVSLREWIRYVPSVKRGRRTRYVDAWKVAGERLEPPPAGDRPVDPHQN